MKGYSYYLYHPQHLRGAARVDADGKGGVYLVGDSLGLAHPITAEGILPATVSGRLLAEAIFAGAPASYRARLAPRAELATAVLAARWVAGRGQAARRRDALVVLADLVGGAGTTILGVAAVISDGAAVFVGSGPASSRWAGGV